MFHIENISVLIFILFVVNIMNTLQEHTRGISANSFSSSAQSDMDVLINQEDHTTDDSDSPSVNKDRRKHWTFECVPKVNELCITACKKSYNNVCRNHKCTSRAKRVLKHECERSCTLYFHHINI